MFAGWATKGGRTVSESGIKLEQSHMSVSTARQSARLGGDHLSRTLVVRISVLILVVFALVALFAPFLQPHDMSAFISYDTFKPPDAKAWLGTDVLGSDVLSRLIAGARGTLLSSEERRVGTEGVSTGRLGGEPS